MNFDYPQFIPRSSFLNFSPPDITEEEIANVVDTLRSGWITTGPKTKQFEKDFAAYVGTEAALAVHSCTGGLHLALATYGIGAFDEVITTPMTFCSSAHVIEHVGARPVLVDIDAETMQMDPTLVAESITNHTKAILPVHYTGHPVDMKPIMELANKYNLYVIEDAAHALPAVYEGKMIGTIGHMTAFSFYATKNLTSGEGGMLTGNSKDIERARMLSLHGMNRDAWNRYSATGNWYYEVVEAGFKYNMTDIQAAIGLVQLKRLNEMQERRYQIVERYNNAFSQIPELQIPSQRPNVQHAWHLYVLRLNLNRLRIDRAQFIEELKKRNIGSSVHFIPVHLHPYYANKYGWQPNSFPTAYQEYQRIISLPLNSTLTNNDIDDVISAIENIVHFNKL